MADKTARIEMRCSPEEKKQLSVAAAAAGLTITGYLLFKAGVAAGEVLGDAIVKAAKKK